MLPSGTPNRMAIALALLLGMLLHATIAISQEATPKAEAQAESEITALVNEFLANVDQRAAHDRMWAADLVYTSSAGKVSSKADILRGFDAEANAGAEPAEPGPSYSAEDILVRPYGDSAALTFRLVAHAADGSRSFFRNSGMLLRRQGQWQVVTWQATREPEEPAP